MTKDYNLKSMKTENQVKSDSTSIDIMEQKTNASLKTNSDFFVCLFVLSYFNFVPNYTVFWPN